MECCRSGIGVVLSYNIRLACFKILFYFFLGKRKAMLVVNIYFLISLCSGQSSKSFFVTKAVISLAFFNKFLGIFKINTAFLSVGLNIWTKAFIFIGTFIMNKAGFLQSSVNNIYSPFHISFLIGVFNTKNIITAFVLGNQISI